LSRIVIDVLRIPLKKITKRVFPLLKSFLIMPVFEFSCSDEEHRELVQQCSILRLAQADGDYSRLKELATKSVESERRSANSHVRFQTLNSNGGATQV
jgi:hypothetical protein